MASAPQLLCHIDQARYVEVGPEGVAPFPYLVALVRLLAVQRVPVLVREDGDRGVAELVDSPESPHRDLAPVGDQHFTHRVERILPGCEGRRGRRPAGPEAGGAGGELPTSRLARPLSGRHFCFWARVAKLGESFVETELQTRPKSIERAQKPPLRASFAYLDSSK